MKNKKVFNRKQFLLIVFWVVVSAIIGAYLIHQGHATIKPVVDNLVHFNLILLGFVLTFFTITTSSLGNKLTKRLQEGNAYYSLMTNFYWLVVLLFFNLSLGMILSFINYSNNTNIVIDVLIVSYIALIMMFLWYGITRLSRFIRAFEK